MKYFKCPQCAKEREKADNTSILICYGCQVEMKQFFKMKCQKCGGVFAEREIHESHDVPCYMFEGKDRKERKNQADKWGRHMLCIKCHDIYERLIASMMINPIPENLKQDMRECAKRFAQSYFKKEEIKDEITN